MWDDQVAAFAARYQVIRFDQRGFGRSAVAAGSFARHEDVRALLDYLNIERAHLLGCSMGGRQLLDFALVHPERVRSLCAVCSGPAGFRLDVPPPRQTAEINAAFAAGDAERVAWLEVEVWVDGPQRTPDQVPEAIRSKVYTMNLQALRNELSGGEVDEQFVEPRAVGRLGEIAAPTLVIIGDLDNPAAVAGSEHIASHVPNARRVVMAGTAHLPNMERPAEFNQHVLDFLAAV
jgi:pimeloyl-ACP methyl ester carboxylesterase